jgi:hypothetical protein
MSLMCGDARIVGVEAAVLMGGAKLRDVSVAMMVGGGWVVDVVTVEMARPALGLEYWRRARTDSAVEVNNFNVGPCGVES